MKGGFWLKLASFLIGFLTLPLGLLIWPPHPDLPLPNQTEYMYFVGVAIVEAVAFGYGYYFLVEGYRLIREKKTNLNRATHVAIAWSLMSWWPHDRLHTHIGEDIPRLLMVEYGFHVTLVLSAIIIAKFFYTQLKENKPPALVE